MGESHGKKDFHLFKSCGPQCPAVFIDFNEAILFTNKLSRLSKLEECYIISDTKITWLGKDCEGYRLPTVSEWMAAAKKDLDKDTWWQYAVLYNNNLTFNLDADICYYNIPSTIYSYPYFCGTRKVAQLKSNENNIYDIYGNVDEWTWGIRIYNKKEEAFFYR